MLHLTAADYTRQPWKNGRGVTTELWRLEREGRLLARLSVATVAEDGPFSAFPGINRNLTVLDGPGFRLTGPGHDLACLPLQPVAFRGDLPLTATGTENRPSRDFNVMTAAHLPLPQVTVTADCTLAADGILALFAPGPAFACGRAMAPMDLILTEDAATLGAGPLIAVRLTGL